MILDPPSADAPASDPQPTSERRALRLRLGEAGAVLAVATALVVATNWTQVRNLTTTAPGDLGDPLYFAWQLAWVSHALFTDPGRLWTTPAFLGQPDNLAFTDTMLGYAPLGLLTGDHGQASALAQLNLACLLSAVLAIAGGYALARAMGVPAIAAAVAGAGFGFAPWRATQAIHLNILSTGGMLLALAFLARGYGWSLRRGWEPERMSAGWLWAGWVAACWQLSLGFAIGIPFCYVLAVAVLGWVIGWLVTGRRPVPRNVVVATLGGGVLFLAVAGLLLRPYLRVLKAHPEAVRHEDWLPLFSPPWRGLLTAPTTNLFWGGRQLEWRKSLTWWPEMPMSPGLLLVALAVAGVFFSVFPLRRRLVLLAVTAVAVVLSLGTTAPGGGRYTYLPLFHHLPGWSSLRTPGRLMIWVTVGLCLLAAGAVGELARRLAPDLDPEPEVPAAAVGEAAGRVLTLRFAPWLVVLPTVLVVAEGLNTTPHWPVPTSPVPVRSLAAPVLYLPANVYVVDYTVQLWGTDGWPTLVNGGSGFDPTSQLEMRQKVSTFPDRGSVDWLRGKGVRTVVLVTWAAPGTPAQNAASADVTGLGLTRTERDGAVVFTLD